MDAVDLLNEIIATRDAEIAELRAWQAEACDWFTNDGWSVDDDDKVVTDLLRRAGRTT